jgi:hypothetical protein
VRDNWPGRLVVKGILDAEGARCAVNVAVDAVVVSNHGGRQLESVPSTVRALPEVVAAIGGQTDVVVDGGIRTGADVVTLLAALGAKAVLVGRGWALGRRRPRRGRSPAPARGHDGRHRHRARPHRPQLRQQTSTFPRSTRTGGTHRRHPLEADQS